MQKTPDSQSTQAGFYASLALLFGIVIAGGVLYTVATLAQYERGTVAPATMMIAQLGMWAGVVAFFRTWLFGDEWSQQTRAPQTDLARTVFYQQIGIVLLVLIVGFAAGNHTTRLGEREILGAILEPRLMAIILAGVGFALFVIIQYATARARSALEPLRPVLRLAWLLCGFALADAAVVFLQVYTGWNWFPYLGWTATIVLYLLLLESLLLAVAYFYQPRRERALKPAGESLLLGWVFGRANPVTIFSDTLERSYGVRLRDTWVAQFLSRALEPLLLAAAILLWLSTCFTVVPVQSEGVRVTLGRFDPAPVGPGLHLSLPWPFGHIHQIDTRRMRSLEIGYGEDQGGPVLWTERHYIGEKNMLVGDGDELLTVNVPVFYRITDPVAFLRHTGDAENAVAQLTYRELVRGMASIDSFGIMVSRRDELRDLIRTGVQRDIDRLGLGITIEYVGLKDIHPPVDVAGAYQDVISAQEDRLTYVIDGETYRTRRLPESEADAYRTLAIAGAEAHQRVLAAAGDTGRFRLVEAAQRDEPALFRTRLLLDRVEATLGAVPKIVLDQRAARSAGPEGGYLLDLRRLTRRDDPSPPDVVPPQPLFDPALSAPMPSTLSTPVYADPMPGGEGLPLPADDMSLPE